MKYMGSKQTMLLNGLGETIEFEAKGKKRVVDLFSGSGAVAWYAAERTHLPVTAVDLQHYAVVLANAVIARTEPASVDSVVEKWLVPTRRSRPRTNRWKRWNELGVAPRGRLRKKDVLAARQLCKKEDGGLVWSSYGGYYFSPAQALTFDLLRHNLPDAEPERSLCLAAVIATASRCAASPGHTAQPFRPSQAALPYITAAWKKDPLNEAEELLRQLAVRHANTAGSAHVADAVAEAKNLKEDDLVILDPPYSAVQYSRFYHVLETIAWGEVDAIEGAGRYPPFAQRPRSDFSVKTRAEQALTELLKSLADIGCTAILTFPASEASNGLSGKRVSQLARTYFDVVSSKVATRFSTLGGNNELRPSRHDTHELIVTMRPQ